LIKYSVQKKWKKHFFYQRLVKRKKRKHVHTETERRRRKKEREGRKEDRERELKSPQDNLPIIEHQLSGTCPEPCLDSNFFLAV